MLNAIIRAGYRWVYRAARVWWFLRRPRMRGAVVAVWSGGRVLLVRTSYRPKVALPGGFIRAGETPAQGAARELFEEVSLDVDPSRLIVAWEGVERHEHRTDTITVFELELDRPLVVEPNQRELVWTGWKTPAEALALPLMRHVRKYLVTRSGGTA